MTIYAWLEYSYYDGLLAFSQLAVSFEAPVEHAVVKWLDSEWRA